MNVVLAAFMVYSYGGARQSSARRLVTPDQRRARSDAPYLVIYVHLLAFWFALTSEAKAAINCTHFKRFARFAVARCSLVFTLSMCLAATYRLNDGIR
jgi:hypothetical protein